MPNNPVNYHDAVVLEDCVEGDAEAVVRYHRGRAILPAIDKVIPIGDARQAVDQSGRRVASACARGAAAQAAARGVSSPNRRSSSNI